MARGGRAPPPATPWRAQSFTGPCDAGAPLRGPAGCIDGAQAPHTTRERSRAPWEGGHSHATGKGKAPGRAMGEPPPPARTNGA